MAKGLIQHIIESLKSYPAKVILMENNDRFLYRSDVQEAFNTFGIEITNGTNIEQRVRFEMREPEGLLILLSQDNSNYLEDIKKQAVSIEFSIANYLQVYHIPSIIDLELSILDKLFQNQPLVHLNRKETQEFIVKLKLESNSDDLEYDLDNFIETINSELNEETVNWAVVSRIIAEGISKTIGTSIRPMLFFKGHCKRVIVKPKILVL